MSAPQEALDSIAERARRALRDNDDARPRIPTAADGLPSHDQPKAPPQPVRPPTEAQPQAMRPSTEPQPLRPPTEAEALPAGWAELAALLHRRAEAVNLVRELAPQLDCSRQVVTELQRRLAETVSDSVHYAELLQRLAQAHQELRRLEGRFEEAQHLIRSTEWLLQFLSDPTRVNAPHPRSAEAVG